MHPRYGTPRQYRRGQFSPRGFRPPWPERHYQFQQAYPTPPISNAGQNYNNSRFEPYAIPDSQGNRRPCEPWERNVQIRKQPLPMNGAAAIQNMSPTNSGGAWLEQRGEEDPTTFEYQASDFLEKLELTQHRKRQIQSVLNDVVSIWYQLMPDVRTVVYGSLTNGLATKYSDIDCFIDSDAIPDGEERIKLMLERWRWMFRGRSFDNVIPIRNARVPIIKATHVITGIPIDLSCTSDTALRNTALIRHLVSSESKFRPLVLLVLSFYRERDLAGSFKFVSYAITLMVVFYLQNVEPPILPPLSKILSSPSPEEWPCRLSGSVGDHVIQTNDMTLCELFAEFFKFYSEIDFEKSVMSPYLGRTLKLEIFKNPALLPEEFGLLKSQYMNGREIPLTKYSFRLQDPILHDVTPATTVTKKILELFRLENRQFIQEVISKKPPNQWLAAMSNLSPISVPKATKQKQLSFTVEFAKTDDFPKDFFSFLSATFEFLLLNVNSIESDDKTYAIFDVDSSYDVFNKRFRGRFLEVIKEPHTLPLVKKYFDDVKNNMKKPESSFCARIVVFSAENYRLKIDVQDTNKNVKNTFEHVADRLAIYLEKLVLAVKCYREQLNN